MKDLFDLLTDLRARLADEQRSRLRPGSTFGDYEIFPQSTLEEMAEIRPTTLEEFSKIKGVGPHKLKVYGEVFIELILKYKEENPQSPP